MTNGTAIAIRQNAAAGTIAHIRAAVEPSLFDGRRYAVAANLYGGLLVALLQMEQNRVGEQFAMWKPGGSQAGLDLRNTI